MKNIIKSIRDFFKMVSDVGNDIEVEFTAYDHATGNAPEEKEELGGKK